MTVLAVRPRLLWAGNGVASSVSLTVDGVAIAYAATSEIKVKQRIVATGVVSTMVLGVDYNVSGTTLTRLAGALPSGYVWAVYRETPKAQAISLAHDGDFSSSDVMALGDNATRTSAPRSIPGSRSGVHERVAGTDGGANDPDASKPTQQPYPRGCCSGGFRAANRAG
jgi:hypothetical protein